MTEGVQILLHHTEMFKILRKRWLTENICHFSVEAPRLARAAKPGQFLIVRADEKGERVPLTICDYNPQEGSVDIVIQTIGASTKQMCAYESGEYFADVAGPLGVASEFIRKSPQELAGRRYLFVAGGVGTAPVYPQVKWLKEHGACVDVVMGAKTASMVILKDEMEAMCDNLYLCTDDGSAGFKGMVTAKVDELCSQGTHYDEAVAIGPMIMMKFVSLTTRKYDLPLTVSLNTLMVDGTGMCGACRVTVGGKTRFACVEGPEFDGYAVDYDEAMRRQTMYKSQEVEEDHKCRIGRGR